MEDLDVFINKLSQDHPGYTEFIAHLCTLASAYLPPFIYITDATHPRVTAKVVDAIFHHPSPIQAVYYAHVNAVACFSARVFYDTVLNALAGWVPSWENGCQMWPGEDRVRYNDSIDSFLHGLRRLSAGLGTIPGDAKGKGKGKATTSSSQEPTMVIMIERAERLCECLSELVVPLTRLAELVSRVLLGASGCGIPCLHWLLIIIFPSGAGHDLSSFPDIRSMGGSPAAAWSCSRSVLPGCATINKTGCVLCNVLVRGRFKNPRFRYHSEARVCIPGHVAGTFFVGRT